MEEKVFKGFVLRIPGVARATIVLVENELHDKPYALLEDVFVEEEYRGQGNGRKISQMAIDKAKELGCYKIVCTSRYGRDYVHGLYESLGMKKHGYSFRLDFH
mgnify:CR=1 FL=1